MSVNYLYGTGRRKTSVARVRLLPGNGEMVVNGKSAEDYFGGESKVTPIRLPFRVTETDGRYSASVLVSGGGTSGQAGAIRHGIARALLAGHPDFRAALPVSFKRKVRTIAIATPYKSGINAVW